MSASQFVSLSASWSASQFLSQDLGHKKGKVLHVTSLDDGGGLYQRLTGKMANGWLTGAAASSSQLGNFVNGFVINFNSIASLSRRRSRRPRAEIGMKNALDTAAADGRASAIVLLVCHMPHKGQVYKFAW